MEGYEVVCARDGQDAVEKAQVELPDLIILDIMMPRMDGWSARAALLELPALRDTPVIFLSARAQQADLRRGYESGVEEYITKPFDPMDLLATIERILTAGAGDKRGASDVQAAGEESGPSEVSAFGRAPGEPPGSNPPGNNPSDSELGSEPPNPGGPPAE
jgi:CheY-like chemotaxis protein